MLLTVASSENLIIAGPEPGFVQVDPTGLPEWLTLGILLGVLGSVVVAALFVAAFKLFPARRQPRQRRDGGEQRRRGELRDVPHEVITAGRELADELGGELHLGVISGDVDSFADDVNRDGVDAIHTVDHGEEFNHDVYAQAIPQLYETSGADVLLMPNTVNGLDYAPAVADDLDLPLLTDAIALDGGDVTEVTREQYGGKVETTFDVDAEAYALTVRPAEWPRAEGDGDAPDGAVAVDIDDDAIGSGGTGFE